MLGCDGKREHGALALTHGTLVGLVCFLAPACGAEPAVTEGSTGGTGRAPSASSEAASADGASSSGESGTSGSPPATSDDSTTSQSSSGIPEDPVCHDPARARVSARARLRRAGTADRCLLLGVRPLPGRHVYPPRRAVSAHPADPERRCRARGPGRCARWEAHVDASGHAGGQRGSDDLAASSSVRSVRGSRDARLHRRAEHLVGQWRGRCGRSHGCLHRCLCGRRRSARSHRPGRRSRYEQLGSRQSVGHRGGALAGDRGRPTLRAADPTPPRFQRVGDRHRVQLAGKRQLPAMERGDGPSRSGVHGHRILRPRAGAVRRDHARQLPAPRLGQHVARARPQRPRRLSLRVGVGRGQPSITGALRPH